METLRILWYNWRCIKHPLAGGAEVYTHEIARRLAGQGHEVILATSRPKGFPREEVIDGYRIVRAGSRYTVYLQARSIYQELRRKGWSPDIIVDEVNTIPFQPYRYAGEPVVMLIHQLCRECWSYAAHPLLQPLGWWLERRLHRAYAKAAGKDQVKAIVTVSESTRKDLVWLGYPEDKIRIVSNGLDWDFYKDCGSLANEKENIATYFGRITPYKRLEDLLEAWSKIEKKGIKAKLVIAGRPDPKYLSKLRKQAEKLRLENIEYKTNISREEKKKLLAKAKTLIYTSTREGWGQTILEAATCKTPAIAYNIPGLRDSVKHKETGILVEPGNIEKLVENIIKLLTNHKLREKLAENAYRYAHQFNWYKTVEKFLKIIEDNAEVP